MPVMLISLDVLLILRAKSDHQIEVIPMLTLEIKVSCPPNLHEFPALAPTKAAIAVLCHCERAILTGANGIVRVEVLS